MMDVSMLVKICSVVVVILCLSVGSECSLKGRECDGSGSGNRTGHWFCPGSGYPPSHTRCCWDDPNVQCCQELVPDTAGDRYVMLVGVATICACALTALIVTICCFWSRCPLADLCHVDYTYDNIVARTEKDDMWPPETSDNCTNYSPVTIKIRPVDDV